MTFWEAVAVMGFMATILGVFMTIYGLINNRTLKVETKGIREILLLNTRTLEEEARGIREILVRIEQGQNEARKEMADAIRSLGELIRSEGEKTRDAVRARS